MWPIQDSNLEPLDMKSDKLPTTSNFNNWSPAHEMSTQLSFVCIEILQPSQPNGVMSSTVSLPNHTFTGQAKSSKRLTNIVQILSQELTTALLESV